MKTRFISIACIISLELFSQDPRIQKLDRIFSSLYATGEFSGNVLIAENGKALYQKSFGFADETTKRPVDINTMSLLGSVSKQFTAFAIVLLKEQGKLSFDDSLEQYFPALPYKHITVRQLLTHTSGIPDYAALMDHFWDKSKFASNRDMVDMLVRYHPGALLAPGEKYQYSNTGYALLASIIEQVSGMSYEEFMEEKIFGPLGMMHTLVYTRRFKPRKVADYALGYVYDDSLHNYILPDQSSKWKNGLWEDGIVGEDGINSTASDMLVWDQALYKNNLISATSLNEIFTQGLVAQGQTDYGFGWHIKSVDGYGKIAYHSGGWPGYMAYIERHLDHNKTIIILRNKFIPELKMPVDSIRAILYSNTSY
jgi:CubicO group peptidase (beta-lactamase class C family)